MHCLSRLSTHLFTGLIGLFTLLRGLALAGVLFGVASPALAAKTYTDNSDGTVTDPTTGLVWMRCAIGQTWEGATCTGTASTYPWDQAVGLTNAVPFAGRSDWRLPNIRELQTIVDRAVYNPALDSVAFPNAPFSNFWSASAYAGNSSYAWVVYFGSGFAFNDDKANAAQVRLVRAGRSFALLDIGRPNADYVDQGNGTAMHSPSRLVWQRCALGQTWTGTTCSGAASSFTWDAAKLQTSTLAGRSDWRLPTQEELLSLVDYSRFSPAINDTLFPSTIYSSFWSASTRASHSGGAWGVGVFNGFAFYDDNSNSYLVRLVRAAKPADLTPMLMLLLD